MMHPYEQLEPTAFWRSGVADLNPLAIREVWRPKYAISPAQKVCTAGSCFAQHIGRALSARGFTWFDAEPAPSFLLPADKMRFNYGVFSFRTANIYTTKLLRQWVEWALGVAEPPKEIWRDGTRYYDPFRPNIEPEGFASKQELLQSRETTFRAIRRAIAQCSVFTFTLGLTEGWVNRRLGYVYAACPGTTHGVFHRGAHAFKNFRHAEILADLTAAFDRMREVNPKLRVLLTVSPVPLTATASGAHVLVATTYSKSVLRAVAGEYVENRKYADYFPSYELVTAPPFRAMFYESNLRSVAQHGVDFVMDTFFQCLGHGDFRATKTDLVREKEETPSVSELSADDIACEEEILESFNAN